MQIGSQYNILFYAVLWQTPQVRIAWLQYVVDNA
jgi:hypothetical protein